MYRKVKKRFVGQFCHAIVIGIPIILKGNQVHLSYKMKSRYLIYHYIRYKLIKYINFKKASYEINILIIILLSI